eukprot:5847741-Prymnesium_polylepis.1
MATHTADRSRSRVHLVHTCTHQANGTTTQAARDAQRSRNRLGPSSLPPNQQLLGARLPHGTGPGRVPE